ncbi:response regulator [Methanococcoides sp. SA1]|nr:response regulator [Methanococcoides sp. SA1]
MKTPTPQSKILIADDMQKWHNVATANLNHYGFHNTLNAYTLKEGQTIYQRESPELILTDINFDLRYPGNPISNQGNLDGLILAREIKEKDPNKMVIVMSSIEKGAKQAAMKARANYFIQKQNFKEDFDLIMEQWK